MPSSVFGPQTTEELAREAPCVWMDHIFFGTEWADDANIEQMEVEAWRRFDNRAANVNEAPWIFNGEYELFSDTSDRFHISVYTLQNGNLRGRRVLKFFNDNTGRWKTFATLRRNGTIFVWSAFRGEEHRAMVLAANFGFRSLASQMRDYFFQGQVVAGREWFIRNGGQFVGQSDTLGFARLMQHRRDRRCQVCNSLSAQAGFCWEHRGEPNDDVPAHAGSYRPPDPTGFLLSENGTGLVR